jgi:membrane dipeptidase
MRSFKEITKDEKSHALALHKESIVVDASLVAFTDYVAEDIWVDDMLAGGITASNATVAMQHNLSDALRELKSYHNWAKRSADKALIASSASDILKAKKEGKHAVIFGPQDSQFLEGTIDFLKIAYEYGIRIIQITYNYRNSAGDGCSEKKQAGLSNYGYELVEEMNKQGILIDLSHTGDPSTDDAIEHSRDPVCFTHTMPRANAPKELSDWAKWNNKYLPYGDWLDYASRRSKTDEQIQACAENGGVIGITPFFVKKAGNSSLTDDIIDQIEYTSDLVGAKYVGFGSDVDFNSTMDRMAYIGNYPENVDKTWFAAFDKDWGYGWMRYMPNVTMGLVARGYSDTEVKGIIGENFYRLFKKVWRR